MRYLDVVGITLYNIRGEPVDSMNIDNSRNPKPQLGQAEERPLDRLLSNSKVSEWEYIGTGDTAYMQVDKSPKLCLWKVIVSAKNAHPLGAIAVSMDTRKLLGYNNPPKSALADSIVVLDNLGRQVYNRTKIPLSDSDAMNLLELSSGLDKSSAESVIGETEYRVSFSRIVGTPFTTFHLNKKEDFIWNEQVFLIYTVGGIVLCLGFLLPVIILISRTLTGPLRSLSDSMARFSAGDFAASVSFHYNDEIGRLGRVFNNMVQENKKLIEHTYALRLKEKEAELSFLQAQINPHFLYNLIHTIQWKALRKGDDEIADLAYSMGQVFRISLNRGRNIVSVRQEKELISYYLRLQKERFGERIEYSLNFDEDTLDIKIPKLIIQPLVENSVVHGAEGSNDTVHIRINCFSHGVSRLCVEVLDDGVGIAPEILENIPGKHLETGQAAGSRIAIRNIYERLKLTYGHRFQLDIKSKLGKGVYIRMEIPADEQLPERESRISLSSGFEDQKMV
jgi:two-component system sensor histidine kinase YesM